MSAAAQDDYRAERRSYYEKRGASTAGSRCSSASGSTKGRRRNVGCAGGEDPDSDVYEWIPGRFAVLHTAYGRIGDLDVGGVEIIRYDAETGKYTSHFFDSQGHVTVDDLIYDNGRWIWTGERIRTTSEFSDDGKLQRSLHEQSDDGSDWRLAMDVTLRRVD